jgi:hypothetical protein
LIAIKVEDTGLECPSKQQYLKKNFGQALPYSEVLQRNAGEMAKAVSTAEKQNNSKAKLIEWSWYLLIAGLTILFASVLVLNVSGALRS